MIEPAKLFYWDLRPELLQFKGHYYCTNPDANATKT